jgi:glycosyltransferase involved in cell wall biosynthesis
VTRHAALFANRCDRVIAPSASLAEVLKTWGVTAPIEVIPNGIELSRFKRPQTASARTRIRKTQRARWNIPADVPLVVYLGRLAPEKNVTTLLEAFALVRESVPDARLLLVGDGPSESELREDASRLGLHDVAHFTGALPYDEVPAVLMACDLFASCSVSEVHPLTFIEAMAAGLPCVGTLSPGVADTVVEGCNGWFALPDAGPFAAVLTEALLDDAELARRQTNALEDSHAYAIETTAAHTLSVYQSVLATRQSGAT